MVHELLTRFVLTWLRLTVFVQWNEEHSVYNVNDLFNVSG